MNRKSRRKKKKAFLREYFQKEIKNSVILPTMKNLIISKLLKANFHSSVLPIIDTVL
jgi:hypothetical protein